MGPSLPTLTRKRRLSHMSHQPISFVALILAAGQGRRMGANQPKAWLEIEGKSVLHWSAERMARVPGHLGTILTVDGTSLKERIPGQRAALESVGVLEFVKGGASRQESCELAFAAAESRLPEARVLLVHDAARPFFPLSETAEAIRLAAEKGGALLGHRTRDTLKRIDAQGLVLSTVDRSEIFQAATPQCFRRDLFERMLSIARENGIQGTDEAGLAEACGIPVHAVECPSTNLKLTWPEDLSLVPSLIPLLHTDS